MEICRNSVYVESIYILYLNTFLSVDFLKPFQMDHLIPDKHNV